MNKMVGKQSVSFSDPPCILGAASICGPKEAEGPLADYFDIRSEDPTFGKDSWEEGESEMIRQAVEFAIKKADKKKEEIRYIFAVDLLGQLIATTFGIKDLDIQVFGLYGACSTCGEGLSLASMTVAAGYEDCVVAATSSHYGSEEKQFRFPLDFVFLCFFFFFLLFFFFFFLIVGKAEPEEGAIQITGVTTGRIVDYGVKDSFNMGACMAPAAADVIYQNLKDFDRKPTYYDRIITGDLGKIGQKILFDLLKDNGIDISKQHMDCGIEIFDNEEQDTHSGGSGCGCSAITLAGYVLKQLRDGTWKRVLFVPTGALLSTVSYNEGQNIPGVAHAVIIERR